MDKVTLCMLAPEFFPVWGGTGSYTIELIKHLPRNVDVHVVTLKRSIPGMSRSGLKGNSVDSIIGRPLKVHYISASTETFFYNLAFQFACLRNIPKLHKEHKFDIMHSHLSHMPDVFLKLTNKTRVPTVLTVHSTIQMQKDVALRACSRFSDLEWSEKYTLLFCPVIKFLQQKYVKRISRFIAVSNATKELIRKQLKIDAEIDLVYNGVDTQLFCPPTKTEVEKKHSRPTVVYVGRMMAKKGLHVLIKAMPEVLRFFPETRFLFVGGGNVPLYKEVIGKMGIPKKNFSFVGHVGYFERPKILCEATVFVNPSFFENCSLSILEAMSCSSAVVASDVGGNPEIIESGKNGLLTPVFEDKRLAESIISLLDDENFNKEIGREARRTVVRSFSSEKCAEETYKVYRQVLEHDLYDSVTSRN